MNRDTDEPVERSRRSTTCLRVGYSWPLDPAAAAFAFALALAFVAVVVVVVVTTSSRVRSPGPVVYRTSTNAEEQQHMTTDEHYDVIVVGLGAMGASALYQLARRGVRALGLEQFDIMHSHGSSAGYSRLFRMCYYEHPDYVPLLQSSLAGWNQLNDVLSARQPKIAGENDVESKIFHQTGGVLIGPPEGMLVGRSHDAAVIYGLPYEMLDVSELGLRYPQFRLPEDFGALYEPQMGFVRASRAIALMLEEALAHGASIRSHERIVDWSIEKEPSSSNVVVRTSRGEEYRAAHVVFAAGPWAREVLKGIHVDLTVTRQVYVWVWPKVNPDQFRLGEFCVWGIDDLQGALYYGFPMMRDNPGMKLAHHSIGEETTADAVDRRIRPGDAQTIQPVVRDYLPDADGGNVLAVRTCLYTNSPDGHFIVDNHPAAPERITIACGFSGHGFKFAPVIGEALADLATKGETSHPIGFLSLNRFE